DRVAGQRTDDVDQQPRRQDDGAVADDLPLERDAEPALDVGGAQLEGAARGGHLDAGERLDGAAGGGGAGHGLEVREQRGAGSRDLHVEVMIKSGSPSSGLWMVCTNPRISAGCGAEERTSLSSSPVGIAAQLAVQ